MQQRPGKRQKSEPAPRQTRSSAKDAPSPPVASTSGPSKKSKPAYDSDAMIDDGDESPFEYESDVDAAEMEHEEDEEGVDTITIDDSESDEYDEPPPEPVTAAKGKLSSRKQYQADVAAMIAKFGGTDSEQVTHFKKVDDTVEFRLYTPGHTRGLPLVLMFPELSGYPTSHSCICFAGEPVGPDVAKAIEEIASLPEHSNKSLSGLVDYLIARLIYHQPPAVSNRFSQSQQTQGDDSDNYEEYDDDDLFGLGGSSTAKTSAAFMAALRKDFKELIAAGFRPGYTRVSELDNVVSVSKKVNSLGVPLRALQAWDSDLITGEVRYLVLLMDFGSKYPVDPDNGTRGEIRFCVGISPKYKPSKAAIAAAFRSHSDTYTKGEFESISLSAPLDSLFKEKFQEVLLLRRQTPKLGWAGAEHHCLSVDREKYNKKDCQEKDAEEKAIAGSYTLPADPMDPKNKTPCNNYPLLAFSYLVRRFVMCPRFCLICFKKTESDIVALKPFVCENQLCLYQLIEVGLGISLEHEIKTNHPAVDLLVQLAFSAAKENYLKEEMQPVGLSLEIPIKQNLPWKKGDPSEDFDQASVTRRNEGLADLIAEIPPILELKGWLLQSDLAEGERLTKPRRLAEVRKGSVTNSAWKLLRWIVASNTSYLKQIEEDDELIGGVPKLNFRQFRLVVGSPAKEHLLSENIKEAQKKSPNAKTYPTLYAWHGSAVKNWHTILREGLHFKTTINGRAYGHGVYFAKEGDVSLGSYAVPSTSHWKNAEFGIGKMAAVCEIVNLPQEFVSQNPYLVCDKIEWIQCRYLVIQRSAAYAPITAATEDSAAAVTQSLTRSIPLDPAHKLSLQNELLTIPDILPKLQVMDRKLENTPEEFNLSDTELLRDPPPESPQKKRAGAQGFMSGESSTSRKSKGKEKERVEDPFQPCGPEILKHLRLLPPPARPNKSAVIAIRKEMLQMVAEQEAEGPSKCGFYYDPERSNDNLFSWVVELTGFDPDLPIAKDMKAKKVSSLLFEIRFPESFPLSPPFVRMVYPRFLPFTQGGGGHVTGGGSICMDLLTADGWSPAYQISAVLLQIRMAISNLEPKPARLDPLRWNSSYSMSEAVEGYKRAAATHGWTVPPELDSITRQY